MIKVLLANHRLNLRSGSELYVAELAEALAARGAVVSVFSLFPGTLAKQFTDRTGIPVYGPDDVDKVKQNPPDIIHSHHLTTFHLLGDLLPGVPRVHGILGVVPDLEQMPVTLNEASRVIAVSERTRGMMLKSSPDLQVEVVKNWFDDRELQPIKLYTPALDARHRVIVVSNNASPERDAALNQLQAEGLVTWERAGLGATPRDITGAFLSTFDVVVTIGRTVPLAGAIGVPCIVADHHLSDGLLTADIVDELSVDNFTGRSRRQAITAEHLRQEIARSKLIDRFELSRKIRADYSLASRSLQFLDIYEHVLRTWAAGGKQILPRRGEGMVYREMARHVRMLEVQIANDAAVKQGLQTQAAQLAEVAQQERERAAELEKTAVEVFRSTSWKVTAPLRAVGGWARRLRPARS